ncbi:hypothetical protein AVEN_253788-1 [Araneus ventricosus]|uniref:Uncharacterized protein n=1 Tax=Araneus ventricosus TaxID=182803 RepID=A0A4Y2J0I9_ARAVE|nr:hypothetical protein AVEN_253788-1 [Araneus ventricosus]
MKRKAYKHFYAIIRISERFSSTSFREVAWKLPYLAIAIRFKDKEFNCYRKRGSFLLPTSPSIVMLITTNRSLSTKSSMEGKQRQENTYLPLTTAKCKSGQNWLFPSSSQPNEKKKHGSSEVGVDLLNVENRLRRSEG